MTFASYSREIFTRGAAGELPAQPVSLARLAALAHQRLLAADPRVADYVFGGAGSEDSMRVNEDAFRRWRIVPRMLRDVAQRDLSRTVLGTELAAPLALAPIAAQELVHPDGEAGAARAAGSLGLPFAASTLTGLTLEQIARAGDGPKWFQLYWPSDPELAESLVRRAQAAGYRALIVTVDNFLPSWRPRDLERGYMPFLHGFAIANYTADPVFRARLPRTPEEDPKAAVAAFLDLFVNPRLTWDDLSRLREWSSVPIAVKGLLHPDDAREARARGVDAVVVSNHGGRQIDGEIASLDALPAIVDAAGGELEVLLDSGVRSGSDVLKALALGAGAVLVGRPFLWGLAVGGEAGVLAVLRGLLADLDLALGLSGHTTPAQLGPAVLAREG
ncbi:MAG: alpha-hydroxy-acid oxidizing protein [Solirubrobacteraceae bacterium]